MPLGTGNHRSHVATLDGEVMAGAVFRVDQSDARWQLAQLVQSPESDDSAIDAVLRRAVQDAGTDGTRRLFARMPVGLPHERALRRSGFVPYTSEHVLRLHGDGDVTGVRSHLVRRVHPADLWGVHQLYLEVVPRQVQYAEAITSRGWDDLQPLRPGARRASGWVLEEQGRVRAFARASNRDHLDAIRLDVLIAPGRRHALPELLAAVVEEVRHLHGSPCLAVVPTWTADLLPVFSQFGFEEVGTQMAFVCYTTVPARAPIVNVDLQLDLESHPVPVAVPGLGTAGASAAHFQHDHDERG